MGKMIKGKMLKIITGILFGMALVNSSVLAQPAVQTESWFKKDVKQSWYVSPFLGYHAFSQGRTEGKYDVGTRFGVNIDDRWSVEVLGGGADTKNLVSYFFGGQISYQQPILFENTFIYALAGIRYDNAAQASWLRGSTINRTVEKPGKQLSTVLGSGLKWKASSDINMRVEGQYTMDSDGHNSVLATAGFEYFFGMISTGSPQVKSIAKVKVEQAFLDTDLDGVYDTDDQCQNSAPGVAVTAFGCRKSSLVAVTYPEKNNLNLKDEKTIYEFYKAHYETLRELAVFLKTNPQSSVSFITPLGDKGDYEIRLTRAQVRVGSLREYFVKKFQVDSKQISTETQIESWVADGSNKVKITDEQIFAKIHHNHTPKLVAQKDWYDQEMMLQTSKQLQLGRTDDVDRDGVKNAQDACENTIDGVLVNELGCVVSGVLSVDSGVYVTPDQAFYTGYGKFYNEYQRVAMYLKNNPTVTVELQAASKAGVPDSDRYLQLLDAQNFFVHKFKIEANRFSIRLVNDKEPSDNSAAFFVIRNPTARATGLPIQNVVANPKTNDIFSDLNEGKPQGLLNNATDEKPVFQSDSGL